MCFGSADKIFAVAPVRVDGPQAVEKGKRSSFLHSALPRRMTVMESISMDVQCKTAVDTLFYELKMPKENMHTSGWHSNTETTLSTLKLLFQITKSKRRSRYLCDLIHY